MPEKKPVWAEKAFFAGTEKEGKKWTVNHAEGNVEGRKIDVKEEEKFELLPVPDGAHPSSSNIIFRPRGSFGDGHWGRVKSLHYDTVTGTVKGWFSKSQIPYDKNLTVEYSKKSNSSGDLWCEVKEASAGTKEGPVPRELPGVFGAEEDGLAK